MAAVAVGGWLLATGSAWAAPPAFIAPVPGSSAVAGRSVSFWMVAVTPGTDPASTSLQVWADMRPFGGPARAPFNDQGFACDNDTRDNVFFGCAVPPINAPLGTRQVTLTVRDDLGRSSTVDVPFTVTAPPDGDGDGLPDDWETRYGFNPAAPGEAGGDPDVDGVTNLAEFQAGTHPKGTFTRYLAEGAVNAFFDTRIHLFNPDTAPAAVLVRFLGTQGHQTSTFLELSAAFRTTELSFLSSLVGDDEFSTVVESDRPMVVERSMTWGVGPTGIGQGYGYGSHAETAVAGPAPTWYFAEGATHGRFDLFYLLENPDPANAADVTITYLLPAPQAPVVRTYRVAPATRRTVWVDNEGPQLDATDVSARIDSTRPIVAERALYYSRPDLPFAAGHDGAGVTAPATDWVFAEGSTGFFDTYVLVANPDTATPATVTVTYFVEGQAAPIVKTHTVAPASRLTINVNGEGGVLAAASMAISLASSVPVVAERAMWWPSGNWDEAHLVAGATATARRWGLAEGCAGRTIVRPEVCTTYVLIGNPSATDTTATIRLVGVPPGGSPEPALTIALPAHSRRSVSAGDVLAPPFATAGTQFSIIVESAGPGIVVERSIYQDYGGVFWASGTALLGTPLTP